MRIGKNGAASFVLTRNQRLASTVSGFYMGVARMGIPGISPIALRESASLNEGFYTGAQLAKMAATHGFRIENPFDLKMRIGTCIGEGSVIGSGTVITGENVSLGPQTNISGTTIEGSNVSLGTANELRNVVIKQGNISIADNNVFNGTQIFPQSGNQINANLSIGNNNIFGRTNIHNETGGDIQIGNHNQFGDNGQVRTVFEGNIYIGNWNSLMMDGGGVISTSYNFGNHWGGDIAICYGVATKRGAELLGLGAYGVTSSMLVNALKTAGVCYAQKAGQVGDVPGVNAFSYLKDIFANLNVEDLQHLLHFLAMSAPDAEPSGDTVLIVGAAKPKSSLIMGEPGNTTEIRDGSRIHGSLIMPGADIHEGCTIYFSRVDEGAKVERGTRMIDESVQSTKDLGYPDHAFDYFMFRT